MRRALLLLLIGVSILAALWTRHRSGLDEPIVDADQLQPAGAWVRDTSRRGAPKVDGEQAAQVLSLPYSAGGAPAPNQDGVVFHDPERAWAGLNLYVSGHGPEVILVDMDGKYLHRWRRDFTDTFPGVTPGPETDFIRRARLLPDGSLLVLFQGGGLARLDRRSEVLWATAGAFFNDFELDVDENRILVIGKSLKRVPELRGDADVLEDFLLELDLHTGRRGSSFPLWQAFHAGGFAELLHPLPESPDIFHSNTVTLLNPEMELPGAEPDSMGAAPWVPGHLLISLREVDVLAVLDAERRSVLWARRGPWKAQHEPVVTDGYLKMFDNLGGTDGGSRILTWDPLEDQPVQVFEHPTFHSPQAGTVAVLPNGNTLVTCSEQGRAFELGVDGTVVWEMVSPHRAGRHDELVATLFEVQRLPPDAFSPSDL